MQVRDDVILGLDIGVGSLGWALLEEDLQTGEQRLLQRQTSQGETTYALGVRLFHVPENAKTKELLNVKRRTARMQRRTTARRAQRMRRVRALLDSLGVPGVRDAAAFHLGKGRGAQCDPWQLRREGLERRLEAREWAVVLLHIAKHRGFRSNSKTDRSGSDKEMGQVLQAVSNLQQEVEASGLTVGALLASRERRRNRADHTGAPRYDLCMLRSLQENEVDILFTRQRELGNPLAGEEVRCRYAELAFAQRPLAPVSHMVGPCAFLEGERRAPRFAPTAELFRYVQALCNMRLRQETGEETPLSEEQRQAACAVFGSVQSVTYKKLRQVLRLPAGCRFAGLSYGVTEKGNVQDPEKADVVMRTGKCCQGTACLRGILGDAYEALHEQRLDEADAARLAATGALSAPAAALLARGMAGLRLTDAVARIVSELNDLDQIRAVLALLPLAAPRIAALSQAAGEGKLGIFQGSARLSLRAMEAILPHMLACGEYAAACELAGFDPRAAQKTDVTDIRNPVVLRVFREVRRQFSAICREFGFLPGRVHVELLREVGKSGEERNRISRGLERRTKEKEAARKAVAQLLGKSPETVSAGEVQRYELWRQQDGKCAYYMLWRHAGGERAYGDAMPQGSIPPAWLADGVNAVQVDHILPRSRTFDNSFHNLCLCCHAANQAKGGRTPWEWLGAAQPQAWHDFEQWVQSLPLKGLKKRNYLLRDLNAEVQGRFHARNLTDSGYVARLTLRWLEEEYARHDVPMQDADGRTRRRFFARPGQVTDFLRRHWGVQALKKIDGQRSGDRHHALDALLVAACSEGMLQRMVRAFQREENGPERLHIPCPWQDFSATVGRALGSVFVSRVERGRTKGPLHEETLRAIREERQPDGETRRVLYERKAVARLTAADLDKIKDAARCPDVVAALRRWLNAGKPGDALPRSAHGDIIRHVRVCAGEFSSGVVLQRGSGQAQASNGGMVRTDIYSRDGKFYMVPVYAKDVADKRLPLRACVAAKAEKDWREMTADYRFLFSLTPDCYVLTENRKGEVKEGYFAGANRNTSAISLSLAHDKQNVIQGIGITTLKRFEKYRVDRFGRLSLVRREADPRGRS